MTDTIEAPGILGAVATATVAAAPEPAPAAVEATAAAGAVPELEPAASPDAPPPPGWSAAAKRDWATLSPDVRAAVLQRESDVSESFRQYAGFRPFLKRCEREGVAAADKLDWYQRAETLLAADFQSGVTFILRQMAAEKGIKPERFTWWAGGVCSEIANSLEAQRGQH